MTPSLAGYLFTPASRSYSNVTANQTAQNYTATVAYQVSGTVTFGGSPIAGVAFAATNGVTCTNSNASGQYSCTVPSGWSGTVTPSFSNYTFTPASRNYANVTAHQTAQNYAVVVFQVSGTVTLSGSPLANVAFAATNGGTCTPSNASGQYSCTVLTGWSGSVTPTLSGHSFTPPSRSHSNVTANLTGQDFTATAGGGTAAISYIHADHLNTPRVITNQTSQVVWRLDQADPFGGNIPNENPSGLGTFVCNLRLPGQYFDKETNTHYNYFRDYDPAIGRYIQSDPIGLDGGINTYSYVGGNPISYADPMGLACVAVGGRVTCSSASGPTFSLPQPPGFSSFISGYDLLDHTYLVTRNVPKGLEECVLQGLINNPTPGNPRPATPNGTPNNAVVTPPVNNWVTSYLTNDPVSGLPLVVNLSGPGAQFQSGYVARGVANGVAFTYGQGNNIKQAPFPRLQNIGNQAVWGSQLEKIIEDCRCR